tara:strand:- start:215 stop:409 length:195 start_codon:yes stop_codon:yes gene_type:complete
MSKDQNKIEDILVKNLSHILKRTTEVNAGDQLAIAQEYKEWINCVTANDFSKQEILVIDNYKFN